VIALYGGWQIALRPFVGWLADVVGRRRLFIASFLFQGVGLVVFAYLTADHWWMLIPYYLIYATGHAIWVVLFITAVADYFGTRRFATLQGLTSALLMPFGVIAPFLAGVAFDATDSYRLIFTLYGVVAALGALCVLLIRRPPGWGAEATPAASS
jgi:MFS family permease